MRLAAFAAILTMITVPALATDIDVRNTNVNTNVTSSSAYQGQHQGQYQGQKQGQVGIVQNNPGGVSVNNSTKVDAEPAYAPNLPGLVASPATCKGSWGASAGGGGLFSLGFGSTTDDDECNYREWAKLLIQAGRPDLAAEVIGQSPIVARAMKAMEVRKAGLIGNEAQQVSALTTSER